MDANAGKNHDANLPAAWWTLTPGPRQVPEAVPLDGSVVFAWIDGHSARRLHFAGDPLVVLPELEHTDAF